MVTSNNLCQNSHNLHAARIEKLSSGKKKKGGTREQQMRWLCSLNVSVSALSALCEKDKGELSVATSSG